MTSMYQLPLGTRFVDYRGRPISISPDRVCLDWSTAEPSRAEYQAVRRAARAIDEGAFRHLVAIRRLASLLVKFDQFRPQSAEDRRPDPEMGSPDFLCPQETVEG